MTRITFVIATFNRGHTIIRSLESIVNMSISFEVIVIDDASTDNTKEVVNKWINLKKLSNFVSYYSLKYNVGVTSAKNFGYYLSKSGWVVFLDSDDMMISQKSNEFQNTLEQYYNLPLIFFRCVDEKGKKIGKEFKEDRLLSLHDYVNNSSYGEALTVINKKKVGLNFCYPGSLRGYEGIGCLRLIKNYGPAILSHLYARVYDRSGENRLSSKSGMLSRLSLIEQGHRQLIKQFKAYLSWKNYLNYILKIILYSFLKIWK